MKIPAIKKLVETYTIEELKKADDALANEVEPKINIEGETDGEKLTHVYGAIFIKEQIETQGVTLPVALRNFTQKVRDSIS